MELYTKKQLNEMTVQGLQDLCKDRDLAIYGVKDDIVRRIEENQGKYEAEQALALELAAAEEGEQETQQAPASQTGENDEDQLVISSGGNLTEEESKAVQDIVGSPTIGKVDMRALEIADQCNKILAPVARAEVDPEGLGLSFIGGPRIREWVTLQQPEKSIYHYAMQYKRPALGIKSGALGDILF